MGVSCLSECPSCNRHVRCEERACPFCGARVSSSLRVMEYRLKTRLDRSRAFSLGAALAAAGFLTNCEDGEGQAVYGAPCNPPSCMVPGGGAGQPSVGGKGGSGGNTAGTGGASISGAASGGEGGVIEIVEGGSWNGGNAGGGQGGAVSEGGGGVSEGGGAEQGGAVSEGGVYEINESGAWNRGEGGDQ
jgi:hypothetical protein